MDSELGIIPANLALALSRRQLTGSTWQAGRFCLFQQEQDSTRTVQTTMKMKSFRGTETLLAKCIDVLAVNFVLLSELIFLRIGPT